MKLVLLGTGGYHPNERRHTACMMLPEEGIVLDAGTGFFRVRRHLATRTLNILISHAHLDHVVGLTFLLSTVWQREIDRITVYGQADKLAAIREHLFNEHLFPAPLPCHWQPLDPEPMQLGSCLVSHFTLPHPGGGSVGYRLDWAEAGTSGRSLAYVTDTTAADGAPYLEAIRGVDVLLHECNFRDGQEAWAVKTGHSSTRPVAELAAEAGVGRLILIHFDSLDESKDPVGLPAARHIFAATDLGHDGMEIEF